MEAAEEQLTRPIGDEKARAVPTGPAHLVGRLLRTKALTGAAKGILTEAESLAIIHPANGRCCYESGGSRDVLGSVPREYVRSSKGRDRGAPT